MDDTFKGRSFSKSVDWHLMVTYLILVLIGWVNIYASIHSSEPSSIFDFDYRCGKQFVWIVTALVVAAVVLFVINPRFWQSAAFPLYAFVLLLLVAVIFLGTETKGSHSWFKFGSISFQPAEISKISTSLMLASFMSRPSYRIGRLKDFLYTGLIIGIPMLIIVAQSETGSALVYVGFILMLYREGLSGWILFLVGAVILLFITTLTLSPYGSLLILVALAVLCNAPSLRKPIPVLLSVGALLLLLSFVPRLLQGWNETHPEGFLTRVDPTWVLIGLGVALSPALLVRAYRTRRPFLRYTLLSVLLGVAFIVSVDFLFDRVLQPYQRGRIEVLLGLRDDPAGFGYNVNQSLIAIGSGGLMGKGFLNGTQTAYGFVPEQSTDFIFCTVGEEWGFLGVSTVLLLYVFLIGRIVRDAERSREPFTRIYGYCVAACIFMHLFINVGMTLGLMPVIGIPLPLLSYGGSSLWGFTLLLFIFIALDRNEKKYF